MLNHNKQQQLQTSHSSSFLVQPYMNQMMANTHINNQQCFQQPDIESTFTGFEGQYFYQTGIQDNLIDNTYYTQIQKYQQEFNHQNQSNNCIQNFNPQQQHQQQQQQLPSFGNKYEQNSLIQINNQAKEFDLCGNEDISFQDEAKGQINSSTSIHHSNDASTCCFSFHQIPTVLMSPSTFNSPKNQKASSSFKINSLTHIQENYYENQNQVSTLQLDQTNYQVLTPSKSVSTSSYSEQTFTSQMQTTQTRFHPKNNGNSIGGNTLSDGESENRRIIQNYQKISKININKNIIKAFKKFMLDKDNSDIITSFGIVNECKNQCKQMKIFFDSLNHNNHSVTKIIDHPLYGGAFEFFLTFYAESWLKSSRVQDKQAHFIAIDFFKLCCTENKVKLSNFKYYSKRKTESNLNNNTLNSSSTKDESYQTLKHSGSELSYNEIYNSPYSEENSQTNL